MKRCLTFLMAFVLLATALGGTAAMAESEPIQHVFAEVENGWLMGYVDEGSNIFLGIPYAKAERFMMPEDPDDWTGIREALKYGEVAPNGSTSVNSFEFISIGNNDQVPNENCQFLNVWTPTMDPEAKKAVIVFIHGGGYSSGSSSELAYYSGQNLSVSGDIVFVSLNHRLNILGYTDLSAYGDEYKYSGNVGQADIIKALEWVRDNIAVFGGDPENVTLVGQSGGAGKVATLMGTPSAQGLFTKAWTVSGISGSSTGIANDVAEAAGVALVEKAKEEYQLATDEEALALLSTISYEDLSALAEGTGVGAGPVVDGEFYPEGVYVDGKWSDLAKDIPYINSSTYSEMSGNSGILTVPFLISGATAEMENPVEGYNAIVSTQNLTEEEVIEQLRSTYGDSAEAIMEAFHKAYPNKPAWEALYVNKGRAAYTQAVMDKAAQGGANAYNAIFAWTFPMFGGVVSWHTGGDLPFLFDNVDKIGMHVRGDEERAEAFADVCSTALVNFAKTGDPSQEGLEWMPATSEEGYVMIFDNESVCSVFPDQELQELLGEDTFVMQFE